MSISLCAGITPCKVAHLDLSRALHSVRPLVSWQWQSIGPTASLEGAGKATGIGNGPVEEQLRFEVQAREHTKQQGSATEAEVWLGGWSSCRELPHAGEKNTPHIDRSQDVLLMANLQLHIRLIILIFLRGKNITLVVILRLFYGLV